MENRLTLLRADNGELVKKQRGALLVHEKIRNAIMWMERAPGSALDESGLARQYGVSRTPIREALLLLAKEGFVQFLPNRTSIVAPLSLNNVPAFLDTFLLLSRSLVRSAVMNGGANTDTLRDFAHAYRDNLMQGDTKKAFRMQLGLYEYIAGLAENRFLEKYFLEAQDASVRLKQVYFFPNLTASDREKATGHIDNVIDSLARNDAEAGDAAVVRSIMFELKVIQRNLRPRYGDRMNIAIPPASRDNG